MATAKRKTRNRRTGQLSAIHVLKSKLGLEDDDYRDILEGITGKRSSAQLTDRGRQRVLDHLRWMESGGQTPDPPVDPEKGRGYMDFRKDDEPRVRKIKAMWIQLGKAGKVERTTLPALNAWVTRQFGVSLVQSLDSKQLNRAIEQLKGWLDRN
ncbi:MAG: regulatory protein GemA [Bacteroidota bacterium]